MRQVVTTKDWTVSDLLAADPLPESNPSDFHLNQRKDIKLKPEHDKDAKKITSQSMYFHIIDRVLYFIDPRKRDRGRVGHLQQ